MEVTYIKSAPELYLYSKSDIGECLIEIRTAKLTISYEEQCIFPERVTYRIIDSIYFDLNMSSFH